MTDRAQRGLAARRKVLGAGVDVILEKAKGAMNEDFQRMLTDFVWGEVWARDGLSLRERSIATLGMLTALNRGVELKTHIRGARNNGLTWEEIVEVFLQSAPYCGFPAAMTSLRLAKEVRDELETTTGGTSPTAKKE